MQTILMVYLKIIHRYMTVSASNEPGMQENELNRFRTVVSEVSYFAVTL